MEWIERLQGKVVALDTAPLIYFIEENSAFLPVVLPFFDALNRGQLRAVTSVLTIIEVLVQPLRKQNAQVAQHYREVLLNTEAIRVVPVSVGVAEGAARVRAIHGLRVPDAIQVATAIEAGAAAILTNDAAWPSLPEVQVLVLKDLLSSG